MASQIGRLTGGVRHAAGERRPAFAAAVGHVDNRQRREQTSIVESGRVGQTLEQGVAGLLDVGRSSGSNRVLLVSESGFLLIGVPPLTLLLVLIASGLSFTRSIQVIIVAGVLSLGFWGGLAGRRAGLRGWPLVLSVLYGLFVGAVVLALQAVLQPGRDPFQP